MQDKSVPAWLLDETWPDEICIKKDSPGVVLVVFDKKETGDASIVGSVISEMQFLYMFHDSKTHLLGTALGKSTEFCVSISKEYLVQLWLSAGFCTLETPVH